MKASVKLTVHGFSPYAGPGPVQRLTVSWLDGKTSHAVEIPIFPDDHPDFTAFKLRGLADRIEAKTHK